MNSIVSRAAEGLFDSKRRVEKGSTIVAAGCQPGGDRLSRVEEATARCAVCLGARVRLLDGVSST